jgi:hypothetical protein
MEDFIHDGGGPGHGGAPYPGAGSLHPGGIHAGHAHASGIDGPHAHTSLTAAEPLGTVPAANQIGNPSEYEHYWFYQEHNGYCVPSSITQVIEAQTGHTMHSYDTVVQEAHALGIPVDTAGMTMPQAQELLSHFGVPSHIENPASPQQAITDLANYLEHGRNVILSVNASPIWYGSDTYDNPGGHADHALVVSAINTQTGVVTLSDPGNPGGNQEQVPLDVFMDAWHASGDQMLVTDHPDGTENSQAWPATQHAAHTVDSAGARAGFVLLPIALGVTALNAVKKRGQK